jgi:hypothetical protein
MAPRKTTTATAAAKAKAAKAKSAKAKAAKAKSAKTKAAKAKKPRTTRTKKNGAAAPTDEDGFLILPKPLLMEYRALDSECRHTHLLLRVASQDLDALLTENPKIQQLMHNKAALIAESSNKKNELTDLHTVIEGVYKVKISNIAIDDDTGRIHELVEGVAAPDALKPVSPPPKKRARRAATAKTT